MIRSRAEWQGLMGYALIGLVFLGICFFFWPGFLSPDSRTQLAQAISGVYTDGSPPMMAAYWGLWTGIKAGPEPMLISHLILLMGSLLLLFQIFYRHFRIAFLLIPLTPLAPHILFYSGAIWKDVGFAFSYLLAALLMARATVHQKRLSIFESLGVLLLLFYGTGVKYQAIFLIPWMSLWFALIQAPSAPGHQVIFKRAVIWGSVWLGVLGACMLFQKALVPPKGEDHMWQHVKLYDLAGISVQLNHEFFPEFVRHAPEYSFEKVKKVYKPDRVDELMVGRGPEASLRQGETPEQRDILWQTWWQTVKAHPLQYLKHRFGVWKTMVSRSPMKSLDDLTDVTALPGKVKFVLETVGVWPLVVIKEATRFIYYFPLLIFYFFLGVLCLRRHRSCALPLTMMSGIALTLMTALFVFSMASDLRYIYLTMVFFHFSHPFAAVLIFGKKP